MIQKYTTFRRLVDINYLVTCFQTDIPQRNESSSNHLAYKPQVANTSEATTKLSSVPTGFFDDPIEGYIVLGISTCI